MAGRKRLLLIAGVFFCGLNGWLYSKIVLSQPLEKSFLADSAFRTFIKVKDFFYS